MVVQKKSSKKILVKKKLGPYIFVQQNFQKIKDRKMYVQTIFGKKNLGQKEILVKIIFLSPKILGSKIYLGQKKVWSQKECGLQN